MLSEVINNPIFVRARQVENRRSRGFKGFVMRYLGATLVLFCPLLLTLVCEAYSEGWAFFFGPAHRVLDLLTACMGLSTFLLPIFVVARSLNGTFGAFSQEYEKQTLDSMLGSRLSADEILIGKLAAGIWPVWREWAVVSPFILAFGQILGHPVLALAMVLFCFGMALFLGVLGLWASAGATSSAQANRKASMTTLLIFFGGPLVSLALSIVTNSSGCPLQMLPLLTSPLVASTSLMVMASQSRPDSLAPLAVVTDLAVFGILGCAFAWRARRTLRAE